MMLSVYNLCIYTNKENFFVQNVESHRELLTNYEICYKIQENKSPWGKGEKQ